MMAAIRDCYPCSGSGQTESQGFKHRCNNCRGSGISPTWELSDGSEPAKRPTPPNIGEDLVARALRTEKRKSYLATNRTAPVIESEYDALVNPDGPDLAAEITRLRAELAERDAYIACIERLANPQSKGAGK
jgi:hypothetical protein